MLSVKGDAPSKTEVLLDELGRMRGEKQIFPLTNVCNELHMHNSLMCILQLLFFSPAAG